MKKLPDDFKINVLLPGAVWLLVSAFIGYAVVAGMGSDAITAILFVVITFVLFVMPMAVRQKGETDKCNSCPVCRRTTLAGQFRCDGIDTRDRRTRYARPVAAGFS